MPTDTITWRLGTTYPVTIASTNATIAELIAGIKNAVDGDAAGAGLWEVSDYSAPNGTLELKRKGSPSGELGTARILFFGGSLPNAAALATGVGLAATNLYVGICHDANTTGPDASYTVGSPYPGKTWQGGTQVGLTTALQAATAPICYIFDADDVFGVCLTDNDSGCTAVAGRIMEDPASETLWWGCMPSGNAYANTTAYNTIASNSPFVIPPMGATSGHPRGTLWNGVTLRLIGAVFKTIGALDYFDSSNVMAFIRVPMAQSDQLVATVPSFLGYLRQMRYGPSAIPRTAALDSVGALQGYFIGVGTGTSTYGMWLDNVK